MNSPTTPHRRRRRLRRALLAAALAACALPAGASAATIQFSRDDVLHVGSGSERNNVSVRQVAGALIVTDSAGLFHPVDTNPFDAPNRCASVDRQTMRCPPKRFVTRMGDGDDTAGPMNTRLPVVIDGGSGNDTYNAGNPSFLTQVTFLGGSGFGADTASYAGSGGSGGGRGVRITNDGQPNDGRLGLDTDNIGRDVVKLIGSPFADEITASVNSDLGRVFVTPGQGDDVMRAGSGPGNGVLFFLMGPVADGADKIIGGPVPSVVAYDDRTRPVTATLNFGGADDGEAGERDEILGGHEFLNGGQGSDILRAPFGSRARHTINGNGGGDFIEGADGPDSLVGGPGLRDVIVAAGGDDQVFAKDGERDEVDCGLGTDTFDADSVDDLGSCENRTIGVLRLAPKALRVKAGETAQLKLSWRHPRAWKQLRRIELRLYRGESRVGAVAISTRGGRIADRGAVSVLRRSRLVRKGKTVSARLALRLGRSLAGHRLRVEVTAVDVRGARQLEPRAGSIRVSR